MLGVLFIAAVAFEVVCGQCPDPAPASNFTFGAFEGLWYEVGKIQTPGGAFWQEGCVCNNMEVNTYNRDNGDSTVKYECRDRTPQGEVTGIEGDLVEMRAPGQWQQYLFSFVPPVSWTVLVNGEDFGVQFDCAENFITGTTEYCIHVISRTPEQDPEVTSRLVEYAESMGLNLYNLDYQSIQQEGCW